MLVKLRRLRFWGPLILACLCLGAAHYVPPLVAYALVIASFVLLFDVGTAWFARAGGNGGLNRYQQ